jgi:hypothetical protein
MLQKLLNWLDERDLQKHRTSTLKKIDQHGWTATYVFGEGDEDHIDFAYTIGFSDFGAPELIVFSLEPMLINGIFWEFFNAMRSGTALEDGLIFRPEDPEMGSFECTLRSAVKFATWDKYVFDSMSYSMAKGRTDRPPVMQVVWPSAQNGKYPWSLGCPATVIESQPALFDSVPPATVGVIGLSS